ncbi:hypothetical protein [Wolbachia endosymbiont (group A) of Longitarsus flavicornis]|uniref:hypothetical protein n=1 Tax=Wolbachia endosymbiont (group A) of Longitarsus flavicornis TaxID=3066134 RepID=UPI0030CA42E8
MIRILPMPEKYILMLFFLSSQCVTLGSKYRHICKLYNGQRILGTYIKNNVHDENKVDPSVTHWDDNGGATWITSESSNQIAFEDTAAGFTIRHRG